MSEVAWNVAGAVNDEQHQNASALCESSFAKIFGLPFEEASVRHFVAVRVNRELTMDFADSTEFQSHDYAIKMSEADFDRMSSESRPRA